MGGWFSSSRNSDSNGGDRSEVTLTSLQPIPGADDIPISGPSSPRSTVPPSRPADDMYRYRYNYPRSFNFSSRYDRYRHYRYSRRYPWYTLPRSRPRPAERDRSFWERDDDRRTRPSYPTRRPTEEPEEPKPEVPAAVLPTKLKVDSINLHIQDNAVEHHTEDYECLEARVRQFDDKKMPAELVVRRGQEFKMTIEFNRAYDIQKNDITLTFNLGEDYKPNKALSADFKVNEDGKTPYMPKKWGARKLKSSGNSLTIAVFIPASVPIGEWAFAVRTIVDVENGKDIIWQCNSGEDINVLFNPWCKEDTVYMESEKWRDEAVLNDDGVQYKGSHRKMSASTWHYGQFDNGILDCAFHLVRKAYGDRATPAMGNAASVSRQISKLVNSADESGVLEGNWSGEYGDGIRPTRWSSSSKILNLYMENKAPVKYGQCWVFSAVTTAVCRALGLPCRSVTNFSSAHNTDTTHLSIDCRYDLDESGDYIRRGDDSDSIWNFHVWNEVYMARPDLDESGKWDGWQIIDATPQERSDGVFCCGPAPLKAIKEGEITVGYDGPFIFSEVNADKVTFREDPKTGLLMEKKREKDVVGRMISTHKPTGKPYSSSSIANKNASNVEREDLTLDYKYEEGSKQERDIVRKAQKKFSLMHSGSAWDEELFSPWGFTDNLEIEFEDPGDVFVGSEFNLGVHVKNTSDERVHVESITLKCFYKTYYDSYTGLAKMEKFATDGKMVMDPGQSQLFSLLMEPSVSLAKPKDGYIFELQAIAPYKRMDGSEDMTTEEFDFRLRRPDVKVTGPPTCSRFGRMEVEVSFTNPFSIYLTNCDIDLSGGFTFIDPRSDSFPISDLSPGETWTRTIVLQPKPFPKKKKEREFTIGFDSRQLGDIYGYFCVELQ